MNNNGSNHHLNGYFHKKKQEPTPSAGPEGAEQQPKLDIQTKVSKRINSLQILFYTIIAGTVLVIGTAIYRYSQDQKINTDDKSGEVKRDDSPIDKDSELFRSTLKNLQKMANDNREEAKRLLSIFYANGTARIDELWEGVEAINKRDLHNRMTAFAKRVRGIPKETVVEMVLGKEGSTTHRIEFSYGPNVGEVLCDIEEILPNGTIERKGFNNIPKNAK